MLCGIVDLGSNTIRLCIFKIEDGESYLLMHRKVSAGLVGYISAGRLSPEGIEVACHVLQTFHSTLDDLSIGTMRVFATASLRNISNTREVVDTILERTGIPVEVLSGTEEAELSFQGALAGSKRKRGLMVDLGGGSTEMVRFEKRQIISSCSMPIGSLNLYNRYVKDIHPTRAECQNIREAVQAQIDRADIDKTPVKHICGVGGSARAACKIADHLFDRPEASRTLTAEELAALLDLVTGPSHETVYGILRIAPERIHTIVPGIIVLDTICKTYEAKDITASPTGVREGYVAARLLKGGEPDDGEP